MTSYYGRGEGIFAGGGYGGILVGGRRNPNAKRHCVQKRLNPKTNMFNCQEWGVGPYGPLMNKDGTPRRPNPWLAFLAQWRSTHFGSDAFNLRAAGVAYRLGMAPDTPVARIPVYGPQRAQHRRLPQLRVDEEKADEYQS